MLGTEDNILIFCLEGIEYQDLGVQSLITCFRIEQPVRGEPPSRVGVMGKRTGLTT